MEGDIAMVKMAHDYFVNLFSSLGVTGEENVLSGIKECITTIMRMDLD